MPQGNCWFVYIRSEDDIVEEEVDKSSARAASVFVGTLLWRHIVLEFMGKPKTNKLCIYLH